MPSIKSLPASPVFYARTILSGFSGNGLLMAQSVSFASRQVLTENLIAAGLPLKVPRGRG
jgi:hypothetical protein